MNGCKMILPGTASCPEATDEEQHRAVRQILRASLFQRICSSVKDKGSSSTSKQIEENQLASVTVTNSAWFFGP